MADTHPWPTWADDAALAARLVTSAGDLALRMRDDGLRDVRHKTSRSDVVTAADDSAETLVQTTLATERPEDGVLGEEGTSREGTSGRRWVIDPVDGTYNFVNGLAHWCSALALADGHRLLGAVHAPVTGETWVGGTDLPTTLNGEPVEPLADATLEQVCAATYLHPPYLLDPRAADPWRRAATGAAALRMLGAGSVDLGCVASGRVGVWFQHSCPDWDWLPGKALVEAAGGATDVVEVEGYRWHVAGRPTAVREVVALLRG